MSLTSIIRVLFLIYDKLETEKNINWVLAGSLSLYLHGVDVQPSDIDLITTREGAYRIARIFSQYVEEPVRYMESEFFRSYFGVIIIDGVKVEVMGDLEEKQYGKWVSLNKRLSNRDFIELEGRRVPLSDLKDQLESYKACGRVEDGIKIRKIEEFLNRSFE